MTLRFKNNIAIRSYILNLAILLISCSCMGGKRQYNASNLPSISFSESVSKIEGEVLVSHLGYSASYNPLTRIPNWVSYELTKNETMGTVKRDSRFYNDPSIPLNIQATFDDYRNEDRWDKGHMAPAGDMKWSEQAMHESCYLTNICPQNRNLNNGDWKSLEDKTRSWAQKYGSIYIICGPIIGEMKNGTLGENKVAIPDYFFKVLLLKIDDKYEGIGFVFENIAGHKQLNSYALSIDEVEELSGLDFFNQLPNNIEEKVEAEYHNEIWGL